jgi:hypothetical protein
LTARHHGGLPAHAAGHALLVGIRLEGRRNMAQTGREPEPAERGFWSWLGFWVQFLLLGLCVVIGAFAASGAAEPGDYAAGVVLILAALALAFLRLKARFDGAPPGWRSFVLVGNMASLVVAIAVFVVVGLAGLFVASGWPFGSLHIAGVALFAVSGVIVFLDLKQVFDRIDSRGESEPHH